MGRLTGPCATSELGFGHQELAHVALEIWVDQPDGVITSRTPRPATVSLIRSLRRGWAGDPCGQEKFQRRSGRTGHVRVPSPPPRPGSGTEWPGTGSHTRPVLYFEDNS